MNANRKTVVWVGFVLGIGALVVSALLMLRHGTNCGGNSAALARVRQYAIFAKVAALNSPEHAFRVTAASGEQRKQLAELAHYHWIPEARFLVSTAPVSDREPQPHRMIAVCDTAYRNLPKRWIGASAPTHAAGYADGSASLISSAEFQALDRSSFRFLDELCPRN